MSSIDGYKVLEIAHRTAWKYKLSSDINHSDTYTFNEITMVDFATKLTNDLYDKIQNLEQEVRYLRAFGNSDCTAISRATACACNYRQAYKLSSS